VLEESLKCEPLVLVYYLKIEWVVIVAYEWKGNSTWSSKQNVLQAGP